MLGDCDNDIFLPKHRFNSNVAAGIIDVVILDERRQFDVEGIVRQLMVGKGRIALEPERLQLLEHGMDSVDESGAATEHGGDRAAFLFWPDDIVS